jgi:hypothetical protein
MCGIFGYSSTRAIENLDKIVLMLAWLNEDRGRQSWGFTDGVEVIKDVGPVSGAFRRLPWLNQGTLIGHTRAASVGGISKDNAHPFQYSAERRVIGVHNGTLSNHAELNTKYNRTFEVDSMHIFKHLAEARSLSDIRGHGAIVYFEDDKLHFSRFNGGQLAIHKFEGGGLIWSSQDNHLEKALHSFGYKNTTSFLVEEGKDYVCQDDSLFESESDNTISKTVYSSIVSSHQGNYQGGYGGMNATTYHTKYQSREAVKDLLLQGKVLIRIIRDSTISLNGSLEGVIEPTPVQPDQSDQSANESAAIALWSKQVTP